MQKLPEISRNLVVAVRHAGVWISVFESYFEMDFGLDLETWTSSFVSGLKCLKCLKWVYLNYNATY